MAGAKIALGSTSGEMQQDANGNAKVNTPTNKAQAGYVALSTRVHDGGSGQAAAIDRPLDSSINKRLRVGMDNLWFQDRFTYGAQYTGVWKSSLNTMTVTHVPVGFIALNGGANATSGTSANYETRRMFPCYNGAGLGFKTHALFNQALQTNNVMELGMFMATGNSGVTDGILFRFTAGGVFQGVVNFNGSETTVTLGTAPSSAVVHSYEIRIDQAAVIFVVDDVVLGTITTPTGQSAPCNSMYQPIHFRNYNSGVTSLAQQLQIGEVSVLMRDIGGTRNFAHAMAGMGNMGSQGTAGQTQGTAALYSNSLAAGAGAAATNTTAALGTGLGGQFTLQPTLAAGTDGIISSFLVPAASATSPGRSLIINGVWIDSKVTAAFTGGPTLFAMSLAHGGDALSMAQVEGAATKQHRRVPLGWQSFPVTSAVGAKSDEGRLYVPFSAPIVVSPGEYVSVIAKNLGTVTSAGTVTFLIGFDAHWE